ASSPTITCTNSVVTVSGSSTTSGVTYQWSSGVASTSSATTTVNAPGTYTLTITDPGNGCTNSGTIVVASSTVLPNVSAGSSQTITCSSPNVTLSGSSTTSGVTYQWSPAGSAPTSASTNVSATGVYTLTVTNPSNGCTNTSTVSVGTNTTTPNLSVSPSQTLTCSVSNVTISGSSTTSGVTYQWNPGGSTPNSPSTGVSATGSYSLTVTDPTNGCTTQSVVVVSTNTTLPNVSAGSNQTITCTSTNVTLSGSSSTSGVTFQWNPGGSAPTSASTNVTASGTYTLTVTNPLNGCINTSTVAVSVNNTLPNLTMGLGQTITCSNQTVTISGSSTTSGATYQWSSGVANTSSATTTVNAQGTYTLTVTDPSNGCTTQGSVLVNTTTSLPNVSTGSNQTLTCNTTTVSISGSSTTPGVTYLWSPAGSTPASATTNVSTAGIYTLTVTDPSNGCTNTSTVSVGSNTTTPNLSVSPSQTLTCSVSNVTISGSSTTSGVTYQWNPGGTTPTSASTNVSTTGNYSLTVTDPSNGCTTQTVVTVGSNTTAPDVSAGNDQLLTCSQTNATLSGNSTTSAATFSWEGPNAGTPAGATPTNASTQVTSTGTYTLTVTDPANGCTSTDIVIVNPDANLPDVSGGSNQIINCNNTTAVISGISNTPGVTYQWTGSNGGGTTPSNNSTTVNYSGTFTLTVTNPANGCSANTTINVTLDTLSPSITITNPSIINCSNTQIILNATTNSSSPIINWNGPSIVSGGNSATPVVSSGGTYSISITDNSNGCSSSASVSVSEDFTIPNVNAGADQTLTCTVSSVNLYGASTIPGAIFNWTGPGILSGSTNDTALVDVIGVYTLTVTDPANGCSSSSTVNVNPDASLPNISVGPNQSITCLVSAVNISGNSTNANAVFSWSGPAGFTSSSANTSVTSPGTYTLTVTDAMNNCSNSAVVSVNDSTQAPGANAGSDVSLTCSSTFAPLSASSGVSGVTYLWNGPNGFTSLSQNTIVSTIGDYTVTVTNSNTGCSSQDTVSVLSGAGIPNISVSNSPTINCVNTTVTISGTSTTNGVIFSWAGPNGFSSFNSSPSVSDSGTFVLTVTDPSNGCSSTATVVVIENTTTPNASSSASSNTITCTINSSTLTGASTTNGALLVWSYGTTPLTGNPVTVIEGGSYLLTATDPSNGCQSTSSIIISVDTANPIITLNSLVDTINCINPLTSISANSSTSGLTYNWSGPNGFSSSQQNSGTITDPGSYSIVAVNPANGCSVTASQNIYLGTNPSVSFSANPTSGVAPLPVNFTNNSDPGFTSYQWSFGDNNSSISEDASNTYTSTGTFTVQLIGYTPNNNCNDTASIVINVYPEAEILIPNVFSPNGDGTNEFFFISSTGLKDLHVDIYDRWGLKVGEINGINGYWDGTNSSEGTYFFILEATGFDNSKIEKQGYLMLVR
ncbi:MAG: gliding motility-associated C-terminal domain-containing protein, partial [Bacteroidota bacterium]